MKGLVVFCACALLLACRTNESPDAQVNDLKITTQVKSKLASDVGAATVATELIKVPFGGITLPRARSKSIEFRPVERHNESRVECTMLPGVRTDEPWHRAATVV